MEDLGSENGTHIEKNAIQHPSKYQFGETIVVGDTTLRLIDANSEVAPALKYQRSLRLMKRVGNIWSIVLAFGVAGIAMLSQMLWGRGSELTSKLFAAEAIPAFSFAVVWILVCGVLGKLFRQRTSFAMNSIVICTAFVMTVALELLSHFLKFNLNSTLADRIIEDGASVLVIAFVLFTTLSVITKLSKTSISICTATICAAILLNTVYVPTLTPEHERWSPRSTISHTGQLPKLYFGKTSSLEAHMDKTNQLFEQLEALENH